MSDVHAGTIEADIVVNSAGATQGVNQAQQAFNQLNDVVRNNWWGLRNVGLAMADVAVAAEGSIGFAIEQAVKWEDSMARVETQMDDTTKSAQQNAAAIGQVSAGLRDLSANAGTTTADQLGKISQGVAALGVGSDNVVKLTQTINDLGQTTDASASTSTTALGRLTAELGLNQDQIQRTGAAIFDLSRKTPATATDIENLAQRLAGSATAAGFTTPQILGLASAIATVAPNSRTGASAVIAMFDAITTAVQKGGTPLETFAKLSGETAAQFAQQWKTDAAGAITAVVEGLGKAQAQGADMAGVMDNLNLKSGSQQTILLALANAQSQNVDGAAKLSNQLQISNEAWTTGTSLQNAAQKQYQTTAAALQEMVNTIGTAAIQFGGIFLPVIKAVTEIVKDFADGLTEIPGPFKDAIAIITVATGAMAAFGAAVFLVGPRVILMRDALGRLNSALKDGAAATTANANAIREESEAATIDMAAMENLATAERGAAKGAEQLMLFTKDGAATQEAAAGAAGAHATQLQLFATHSTKASGAAKDLAGASKEAAAGAGEAGAAVEEAGVASEGATGLFGALGESVEGLLGPIGLVIAAIGLIGSVITTVGALHHKAAADTKEHAAADMGLVDAIKQEGGALSNASKQWIIQQLTMSGALESADKLKISYADLISVVEGVADPATTKRFTDAVTAAAKGGDEDAKKLAETVKNLHDVFRASADAAVQQSRAENQVGVAADGAAGDLSKLGDAVDETNKKQSAANQALISYTSALLNQQQADLAVDQANKALAEALDKASKEADNAARAELALNEARLAQREADAALVQAEADVANARSDAAKKVEDANLAVGDAEDKLADSNQKILDATKALNDAQNGATEKELRDAVNALADSRLKLVDANRAASDAQWYLNYLQHEGASNRDIQIASENLDKAHQQVADSAADAADKQDKLNQMQAGADPTKVAAAQRTLTSAIRDQERAVDDLEKKQKDLAQAQADLASDKGYIEAIQKQEEAQFRVEDAANRVADASQASSKQQADDALSVRQAQLGVEDAIYRQATANVEVQKQAALAKGEQWNAGKEAQALSDQLTKLGQNAAGPVRDNIMKMAAALHGAVDTPDSATSGTGPDTAGKKAGTGGALGEDTTGKALDDIGPKVSKHVDAWGGIIKKGMGIIGGFVGASVGADIGAGLGSFGGPLGTIIGAIAGFAIGEFVGKLLTPLIEQIVKWTPGAAKAVWHFIEDLPKNIGKYAGEALRAVGKFFSDLPGSIGRAAERAKSAVTDWIKNLPETVAKNIGLTVGYAARGMVDLVKAISKGIQELVHANIEGWKRVGEDVIHGLEKLPGLVTEAWHQMYMAVKHEIENIVGDVKQFIIDLPDKLEELKRTLPEKAHQAWNAFAEAAGQEIEHLINWAIGLPGRIRDAIGDLAGELRNKAASAWHAFVSGVTEAYPELGNWLAGLPGRLRDSIGNALDFLHDIGGDVIRGLWHGIDSMSDWFRTNIIKWIEDHIPKPMREILQALSPSKRTHEIGTWVVQGMAGGIEDNLHLLEQASVKAANAALPNLSSVDLSKYTAEPHKLLAGSGVGAASSGGHVTYDNSQTTHEGDKWEVNAANMDPIDLMREADWRKRTRRR